MDPQTKPLKLNERDFLMYFHTAIRNLGLYLSASLAILGVSRAYRGKNRLYNVAFIVLSLAILCISIYKNYYLIINLQKMAMSIGTNQFHIRENILVPQMFLLLNGFLAIFSIFTLFREFTKPL